jgi:tetratricopeptide (TPR) repeat protein
VASLAGELDAALAAYDEAARLVPERPLPLASRGTVLHRLDRWPEAVAAFDQALQLAPDDEAALRARATARAERGLRTGAAADFERLAFVLDVAGRAREAADAARQVVDLEPSASRKALADRLAAAAPHGEGEGPTDAAQPTPSDPEPERRAGPDGYEALEALRAGLGAEDRDAVAEPAEASAAGAASAGAQPAAAELVAAEADAAGATGANAAAAGATAAGTTAEGDQAWPGIDLPSPPPPPVDANLDPEALLAEAATVLESGDAGAARDLMLTAIRVHRDAGRIDSTQAAADVHGLASERLRDEPTAHAAGG